MVELLQHFKLIVDHLLIPADIFLEDNFDGDLSSVTFRLTDDTICSCTEGPSKFIRCSRVGELQCQMSGRKIVGAYFFS